MTLGNRQSAESLNHILGKTPDTTPAGIVYISLHTASPGDDGQTSNEATGTGYARITTAATDWDAATTANPAVTQNANELAFALAGGDWSAGADFTHFAVWSSLAGTLEADFIADAEITILGVPAPRAVLSGDEVKFAVGALEWSMT